MTSVAVRAGESVRPGEVLRPAWRRLRLWAAISTMLVLGALLVASLSAASRRPLDPSSPHPDGSKALAHVLAQYGVSVSRTSSLVTASGAGSGVSVLILAPDEYSATQLRQISAGAGSVVLIAPGARALDALAPGGRMTTTTQGSTQPNCVAPGARSAGPVDLPPNTHAYNVPAAVGIACYDATATIGAHLTVLGSSRLLRNDTLGAQGVAALDVNAISSDRTLRRVVWLMPGTDASAGSTPSFWQLFPDGAHRAFWWLLVIGVLLVLWRARRLGPVIAEPLPVVVRSAELVEGHGRLYRRAAARDRAASALRSAAVVRLVSQLGLQRGTPVPELVSAVAIVAGRAPAEVADLLAGPIPSDDAELVRLAGGLDALERAAGVPPRPKGQYA